MSNKDLITIAIPVFNEVDFEDLVFATHSLKLNKEIIIVDDGSTLPETENCLKRIQKRFPKIRILVNQKNIGKALSVQRAIKEATGNIFVILDADYELDPRDIVPLYEHLKTSGAALVNGRRVVQKQSDKRKFTSMFSAFSKVFMTFTTWMLYGQKVEDVFCGYKMFKTELFKNHDFTSERFGLETELIVEAIKSGSTISEIDVHYHPRTYKEGKKINIFDSIEILLVLFKKSKWFPRFKNTVIGLAISLIAFTSFTWSMDYYPTTDSLPNNFTAFNIMFHNRIDLDNYEEALIKRDVIAITVENDQGIRFAKTPPILGILSLPGIYFFHNVVFNGGYITPEVLANSEYSQFVGKYTASVYAALAAALMYFLALKLFNDKRYAALATFIFTYATGVFNVASQANWQHAVSLFFILLYLVICMYAKHSKKTGFILGLIGGLFWQIRISNAFYLIVPIMFSLGNLRKNKGFLISYFMGIMGMYALIYGFYRYLHVPYGYSKEIAFSLEIWTLPKFFMNMFSVLFSYNLGLFFAHPVLLLSIPGLCIALWRWRKDLNSLIPTLVLFLIFVSSWWAWSGGRANNARLLSEALPIFVIFTVYAFSILNTSKILRVFFIAALLFSIFTNIITVYAKDFHYYDDHFYNGHNSIIHNAWTNDPILYTYLLKREMLFRTTLEWDGEDLYRRDQYYRPSLKYRAVVKLFDGRRPVLIRE